MAIRIRFIADIADWVSNLGRGNAALEDTEKGLEEVMREAIKLGKQAGLTTDQIANDFSKAFGIPLDRAKAAVSEVIGETKRLDRAQSDAGRESGKLGDNLSELGSIARDVLAGDFAGAADSALGALSGVAAAAGIGGAVGGAILEAVGGLAGALIEQWQSFPNAVKESRDELVNALVDAGGAFDDSQIESRIKNAATNTETWNSALLIAQATGRDVSDVLATLAGVTGDADATLKDWNASWGDLPGSIPLDSIDAAGAALQGISEAGSSVVERQAAVADAMQGVRGKTDEATQSALDFKNSLDHIPGLKEIVVKATVDDSAVRNYKPPRVNVPAYLTPDLSKMRQLLG